MKRDEAKKKKKPSGRRYEPIDQKHLIQYQKIKDDFLAAIRKNPDAFLGLRQAPTVENALRVMLQEAIADLKRFELPATPHVWTNKDDPKTFQLVRTEECQEKTYLPDFLLSNDYTWDSTEHLTAKKMCLIYEIDALGDWVKHYDDFKKNKSAYFFRLAIELGQIETLLCVYDIWRQDSARGGRSKENPFKEYGMKLRGQSPDESGTKIWKEIPRVKATCEDYAQDEPDEPHVCHHFNFYRVIDDDKEFLVALDATTGKIEGKTQFKSFCDKYLKKNSRQ